MGATFAIGVSGWLRARARVCVCVCVCVDEMGVRDGTQVVDAGVGRKLRTRAG